MTAIQRFIEKAIEGGWKGPVGAPVIAHRKYGLTMTRRMYESHVILDPEAWKAVGKVEEWPTFYGECDHRGMCSGRCPESQRLSAVAHMHRMIDALVEGRTIEEYLSIIL